MTVKVTNTYNLKLTPSQFGQNSMVVNCSQYDSLYRVIQFNLYNGSAIYSIPEGSVVTIRGTKKDMTGFEYECDYYNNAVTFPIRDQITIYPGKVPAELRIVNDGEIIGSWNFVFLVEESPLSNDTIISETQLPLLESALQAAAEAENYKNLAQQSADNASESEQNASESEANALTYSQNAQTSANNASESEDNALTYSQNASESATEAQGFAQEASESATEAQGYATQAEQSAQRAESTAQDIEGYVDDAQGYASQASQSATNAQQSASNASQSATNASASASSAQTYASNANQSAQNASSSATSAQTYAGNASTSATQSASSATQSAQSATNAQTYANNASASATQAQGYATNAGDSATASADSANDAQGFALNASNSADEAQEAVETIDEAIKNKADVDGVYPKLIAGGIVETETNDVEFTYKVSEHTGIANLNSIKGNTIVWNQLLPSFTSSSDGGMTWSYDNGLVSVSGTATNAYSRKNVKISINTTHKYALLASTDQSVTPRFSLASFSAGGTESSKRFGQIAQFTESGGVVQLRFTGMTVGETYDKSAYLMVIDLTAMFGAGNEPTSLDEFTALFPLPYYAYESGKLLSFNGTGIKVTNEDTSVEETLSLPIATYFPTGMMSYGNVYDELTPTKAYSRMRLVDLGTLEWTANASYTNTFNGSLPKEAPTSPSGVDPRGICDKYQGYSSQVVGTVDQGFAISANGATLYVRDVNYSDVATFKSAMSGFYLAYVVRNETVVDVDLDLSYRTYEGGTEQLLPANTDVPVTSPFSANIEFDFDENINARITKLMNSIAQVETSPSQNNYSVGQYLIYDYQLYKVTSAIAVGGTLTVGTNIVATTVMSELLSLTA